MSTVRRKRYTQEEKHELLKLFEQSSESASRFCKDNGVSYPTLKRWLGPDPAKPILAKAA